MPPGAKYSKLFIFSGRTHPWQRVFFPWYRGINLAGTQRRFCACSGRDERQKRLASIMVQEPIFCDRVVHLLFRPSFTLRRRTGTLTVTHSTYPNRVRCTPLRSRRRVGIQHVYLHVSPGTRCVFHIPGSQFSTVSQRNTTCRLFPYLPLVLWQDIRTRTV